MLKLKIVNKPKMLKIKCGFKFPEVVLANLQEKEVIPTKEKQEVIADNSYDGLSKVIVDKIPNEYIIPQGQIDIIKNGIYDVTDKVNANVNVPEKVLGTKTITTNGIYKASNDNLDGYSEVEVSTSGVDINDYYDLTKRTSGDIKKYIKQIPMIDTSDYTSTNSIFGSCSSLTTIPQLDTSKVTSMNSMFDACSSLVSVPELDASKVTDVYEMFNNCPSLTTLGGFTNLGNAYSTTKSANYEFYKLNLSYSNNLTHDSLMNVINNLYDIASAGIQPQQLVLGSANLAKLTSEEITIAQNKGWNLS